VLLVLLLVLTALLLRSFTAGHFRTTDERTWMGRSERFSSAIAHGRLEDASATTDAVATMPGITTMWLGSWARGVWLLGGEVGAWSLEGEQFVDSATALHLAELAVALASALLIGVIVLLARRWASATVALTAGILLATEPFVVAHGAVLHTDELAALFGAAGVLALLIVIDVPSTFAERAVQALPSHAFEIGTGALLAGAFLTKVSALALGPGLVILIAYGSWCAVRNARVGDERRTTLRQLFRSLGVVAGAGIVTVLVLWPAVAVAPGAQLDLLRASAELGSKQHLFATGFFLGEPTQNPGPWFYAVAMPLRMTPWMLLGSIVGVPVALAARRSRPRALCMLAVTAPVIVVLSLASKQFDRYAIAVLPFLAIVIGLAVDNVASRLSDRRATPRRFALAGGVVGVAIIAYSFSVVPWGLAYFNPLLGAGSTGEKAILVGWGEGLDELANFIDRRQNGHCDERVVIIGGAERLRFFWPRLPLRCGEAVSPGRDAPTTSADYIVVYVNIRQRMTADEYRKLTANHQLLYRLVVRGIDYGDIYSVQRGKGPADKRG
jgi:hypothetical protein